MSNQICFYVVMKYKDGQAPSKLGDMEFVNKLLAGKRLAEYFGYLLDGEDNIQFFDDVSIEARNNGIDEDDEEYFGLIAPVGVEEPGWYDNDGNCFLTEEGFQTGITSVHYDNMNFVVFEFIGKPLEE